MTRTFGTHVCCPKCGTWHTAETAFERWMRNETRLDSRSCGLVRFDCDVLLHKYLTLVDGRGTRALQAAMFIEVKTKGALLTTSQQDTLSMFSQVLRNRRRNIHSDRHGRHALDRITPSVVRSHASGKDVRMWLFGGHLLTLSGDDPSESRWMEWDRTHRISTEDLIGLLTFTIDPDTMRKIDWRRRYASFCERPQLALDLEIPQSNNSKQKVAL